MTREDIERVTLPSPAWSTQVPSSSDHLLTFVKVQEQSSSAQPLAISHTVTVHSNFTWTITVHGHLVTQEQCSAIFSMPVIANTDDLAQLLAQLDQLRVCPGHPDQHFIAMANARKGKFTSSSGDIAAYLDTNCAVELNGQKYTETVRSSKCHLLIRGTKCSECVAYRDTLRSIHHRWSKKQNQSPSKVTSTHSHANERWLNTPQRKEKVLRLKSRMRASEKRVKYMEDKIKESTERKGVQVDDPLHVGLNQIMSDHTREIQKKYEEGSFHRLFWDQQTKNVSKYPTQRRWHPMLIRWCLHLKMMSSSAYDALRGILTLPCGRTLQDYTHFIKAGVGIQTEVTEQLMTEAKIDTLQDSRKYVAVVFDEMKIKEGIVYDKNECVIIGFTDLGNVNSTLQEFEESINDNNSESNVAKQMLVFMVRGVFIKLRFPYAQYPTQGITADYLFPLAWEVVKNLECAGFKVISLTGDKASPNRKFFRLHRLASGQKSGAVYKVLNPYSIEKRFLYFISDVPHLVKTARNCWSNSFSHSFKRALWVSTTQSS